MDESAHEPLILTLAIDDDSALKFNSLRTAHFPAAINYINAHLTLFHQLPADEKDLLEQTRETVRGMMTFEIEFSGLQNLGRGVAFKVLSPELSNLHAELKKIWGPHLSRQDQQPFRPHITIQNKVTPENARELLATLGKDFTPFRSKAMGVEVYTYLGAAWRFDERIEFGR